VAASVKVRWTALATDHLKSAHEYIAAEDVAAADRLIERILSAVQALGQHPQLGRKGRVEGTRELVLTGTPFIVAYRLRHDQVEILAVLHGARRWPERF
jgi:toxin ParE1/3/4